MIGMPVRDQRVGDRLRGIDPAIGGNDMYAVRLGPDPCEGGGHLNKKIARSRGFRKDSTLIQLRLASKLASLRILLPPGEG